MTIEELKTESNSTNKEYLVGAAIRPGSSVIACAIEHRFFYPEDKTLNDQYSFGIVKWGKGPTDQTLEWFVMGYPKEYAQRVRDLVTEYKMRVADGIPTLIESGKKTFFPLNGNNVFSIEDIPGSPIYSSDSIVRLAYFRDCLELAKKIPEIERAKRNGKL